MSLSPTPHHEKGPALAELPWYQRLNLLNTTLLIFFLAVIFAYIFRGNIVASLIGTFVGNPFTFPFIWIFIYKVGNIFFKNDQNVSLELTFQSLFDQGYDILMPMLIGSLIVSIPIWLISYFTLKFLMSSFKKRRV